MKNMLKLSSCLVLAILLCSAGPSNADKVVASGTFKACTVLSVPQTMVSPYFPLKAMVVTGRYVAYQVMNTGTNTYYVAVRYAEAQNSGDPLLAPAPVNITVTGTISITGFSGTISGTILSGDTQWSSQQFTSSMPPQVSITSTSPGSISGIPITIWPQ